MAAHIQNSQEYFGFCKLALRFLHHYFCLNKKQTEIVPVSLTHPRKKKKNDMKIKGFWEIGGCWFKIHWHNFDYQKSSLPSKKQTLTASCGVQAWWSKGEPNASLMYCSCTTRTRKCETFLVHYLTKTNLKQRTCRMLLEITKVIPVSLQHSPEYFCHCQEVCSKPPQYQSVPVQLSFVVSGLC